MRGLRGKGELVEVLTRAIANEYRDRVAGGEYHKWLSHPGLCENRRSKSSKGGGRT